MLTKAADGKRKPRTTPLPRTSKRLSTSEVDEIKAAWTLTHNTAKISRQLGIHEQTVRKYLQEAGITTAARVRTERDNARMIELYMEGRSIRDVATRTGWSKDTVWNVLLEHREKTDAQ
jgi:transposase